MVGVRSPYASPRGPPPTSTASTPPALGGLRRPHSANKHVYVIGTTLIASTAIYFGSGGGRTRAATGRMSNGQQIDVDGPPILRTGQDEYDWAYRLALEEIDANVGEGDRFIAGEGWAQLWTRDTSYAAESAASLLYPAVVRSSLEASVEVDPDADEEDDSEGAPPALVWLQDSCAHFGGWPVLSDAIVGARGAWSLYLVGGNRTFLSWAYDVTRRSLKRGERDAFDDGLGLFRGCSSFMESNSGYPAKYHHRGDLVGMTKALSTNALYYSGYSIAAGMARELGKEEEIIQQYEARAIRLRESIRSHLWLGEKGYYSYVMDENNTLLSNFEGLGEALVLMDGIETDTGRIQSIFDNVKQQRYGLPCLWPPFDLKASEHIAQYYHNGRLWPFVQGYYAMAAARHGRIDVFAHALQALKDLAVKSKTFAEFYEINGTFPAQRSRQLWSETGYLAMIHQGLFGLTFEVDRLCFAPLKPKALFPSTVILENLVYQNMVLDISIKGQGGYIKRFELDGKKQKFSAETPFISSKLTGRHTVKIVMGDDSKA